MTAPQPADALTVATPDLVAPEPLPSRCVSCGTDLAGLFCHVCGERLLPPGHLRVGRYLRDAFEDVTNADGALWRSLSALLLRPGLLTREWLDGRRQPYVRPVRFFLITNVAFFLLLSFLGGSIFRGSIDSQRVAPGTGPWATERFEQAVSGSGVSEDVYTAMFNQHADTLARTLIVLLVPLLAVVFGGLLAWRREPFVAHIVFATHIVTGMMALTVLVSVGSFLVIAAGQAAGWDWGQYSLDPFILLAVTLYLVLAVRQTYRLSLPIAIGTGALAMVGLMTCVLVFQFLLFLITVWTLSP